MLKSLRLAVACLSLALLAYVSIPSQAQNYPKAERTPSASPGRSYPTAGSKSPNASPGTDAAGDQTVTILTEGSGTLTMGRLEVPFQSALARWENPTNLQLMFTTAKSAPPTTMSLAQLSKLNLWNQWKRDYVDFTMGIGFDEGPRSTKPTGAILWISDRELTEGSVSSLFAPPGADLTDYAATRATLPQYVTVKRLDRSVGGVVQIEFKDCRFGGSNVLNGTINCSVVPF